VIQTIHQSVKRKKDDIIFGQNLAIFGQDWTILAIVIWRKRRKKDFRQDKFLRPGAVGK